MIVELPKDDLDLARWAIEEIEVNKCEGRLPKEVPLRLAHALVKTTKKEKIKVFNCFGQEPELVEIEI